jgi:hypothetical protein
LRGLQSQKRFKSNQREKLNSYSSRAHLRAFNMFRTDATSQALTCVDYVQHANPHIFHQVKAHIFQGANKFWATNNSARQKKVNLFT